MVLSKINELVSYTENKEIDADDKGRDVSMYKISLFKVPIIIALGDVKYTYIDNKILYVPVYLIANDTDKIYQIGVYEINSDNYENVLDDDNDFDISIIEGPLLYSFVDKAYIQNCIAGEDLISDEDSGDDNLDDDDTDEKLDDIDTEEEEDSEIDKKKREEKEDDGEEKKGKQDPDMLIEIDITTYEDDEDFLQASETEKDDKIERKKFTIPSAGDSKWIEEFMHNNNYNIIDNDGGGDCLFFTIRDAFKSIGINASVDILRNYLSSKINDDILNTYKERYDMFENEYNTLKKTIPKKKKQIKQLTRTYNGMAKKSKQEKDRQKKMAIVKDAKIIKKKHKEKKEELKLMEKELINVNITRLDWEWAKDINTVDDLKEKVKTCDFWADGWAISTLEIILNTKIIILSSEHYNRGRYKQVLNCGEVVPSLIEKRGYFKPKYYIIVEHTGDHYKLITYKEYKIFRFHHIPWGIKNLIKETCMKQKGKSLYNYIPKFSKIIGQTINIPVEDEEKPKEKNKSEGKGEGEGEEEKVEVTPTSTPDDKDLFDEDLVFVFYSKSADKTPGKGTGEKIHKEKISEFEELGKIKNWRRVLSNFYTKPKKDGKVLPLFKKDGLDWASVEHYFHANKFKKNNPDYYKLFSINSGSQIMGDPKKALGAGGKTGKVNGKKFRPKNIIIDQDFYENNNREQVMERAQKAKYEQDELSKKVLLATKNAKLVHYTASRKPKDQRPPPVIFYDTMRIRNKLQNL